MKKFYVYVHVCPNGKRYVGITAASKPEYRWGKNGEKYKGQLFERAIRKYGWSNITHEVFEVDSAEEMYRKEVELISFYHSNDPEYGYNLSGGGESGHSGCRYSEEHRKKLSKIQKKVHSDPEYRKRISETLKGRTLSEDHKRHIAEAKKGKSVSEEARKRIAENNRRKAKDPEFRKRLSEAQKNRPRIKIKLPDGTILEMTKQNLTRNYIKKGKKFEYLSY